MLIETLVLDRRECVLSVLRYLLHIYPDTILVT